VKKTEQKKDEFEDKSYQAGGREFTPESQSPTNRPTGTSYSKGTEGAVWEQAKDEAKDAYTDLKKSDKNPNVQKFEQHQSDSNAAEAKTNRSIRKLWLSVGPDGVAPLQGRCLGGWWVLGHKLRVVAVLAPHKQCLAVGLLLHILSGQLVQLVCHVRNDGPIASAAGVAGWALSGAHQIAGEQAATRKLVYQRVEHFVGIARLSFVFVYAILCVSHHL